MSAIYKLINEEGERSKILKILSTQFMNAPKSKKDFSPRGCVMIIVQTRIKLIENLESLNFLQRNWENYLPPKNMQVIIQYTLRLCEHIKIKHVEFPLNIMVSCCPQNLKIFRNQHSIKGILEESGPLCNHALIISSIIKFIDISCQFAHLTKPNWSKNYHQSRIPQHFEIY